MKQLHRPVNANFRSVRNPLALVLAAMMIMTMFSGCYFLPEEEEALAPPLMQEEEIVYTTHRKYLLESFVCFSTTL